MQKVKPHSSSRVDAVHAAGCVAGGRLKIRNWPRVSRELAAMPRGEVTVTIRRARATRSEYANRYYFGVVLKLIAENTGHAVDELHEDMRLRFLTKPLVYVNEQSGEVRIGAVPIRSSKLTTVEFYEYVEKVRLFAAEFLGLTIPDPDPNYASKRAA